VVTVTIIHRIPLSNTLQNRQVGLGLEEVLQHRLKSGKKDVEVMKSRVSVLPVFRI
jgi:hypothetical protein